MHSEKTFYVGRDRKQIMLQHPIKKYNILGGIHP